MLVLGLDPAIKNVGWVVLDVEADGRVWVEEYGCSTTKTDQPNTFRYILQESRIREVFDRHDVDAISVEQPQPNDSYSAGLYPIYIAYKRLALMSRTNISYFVPSVLKADGRDILSRKGSDGSKEMMVEAADCLVEGTYDFNDHEADAIHAAYKGARLFQLVYGRISPDELTEREETSLLKVVNHRDGTVTRKGAVYKEGDDRHTTYTMFELPKYDFLYG
jgi:hypothetical protein